MFIFGLLYSVLRRKRETRSCYYDLDVRAAALNENMKWRGGL